VNVHGLASVNVLQRQTYQPVMDNHPVVGHTKLSLEIVLQTTNNQHVLQHIQIANGTMLLLEHKPGLFAVYNLQEERG